MTSFVDNVNKTLSTVMDSLTSFADSIANATEEADIMGNTVLQKLEDASYNCQGSVVGGFEYIRESAMKTLLTGYNNFMIGMAVTLGVLLAMLLLYLHRVCSGHTSK